MRRIRKYLQGKAFSIPVLPLWLFPVLLLGLPILQGKVMFWGTPYLQFVPWRWFAWESILNGELPLWNPMLGMGAPLLANYQSAIFYPPNWLQFFLAVVGGIEWMAWGQGILVLGHIIFAGLGMAAFGKRMGLGDTPQAVMGLAFGMSQYLVARSGFLSINSTLAWLPWIMVYVTDLSDQDDNEARYLLRAPAFYRLTVCVAMLLLAGHAQTAWYSLLLSGLWFIFRYIFLQPGDLARKKRLTTVIIGVAAILLAVFIASIQLIPTVEYLQQSQRAEAVDYDYAMNYSFWPWRFISLIAPDFFGNPATGDYLGDSTYWEDAVYVGLLTFLLALGFLFVRKKTCVMKRIGLFWLFAILISFILALGKNAPIFPFLYRYVPTFDMFQAPTRFSVWGIFGIVVLGGYGMEIWRRPEKRALYWMRLGTMAAFAMAAGAGLAWILLGDIRPTFIRAATVTGITGVFIGVLNLLAPTRDGARRFGGWQWCVVGLLGVDLLLANWGAIPFTDAELYSKQTTNSAQYSSGRIWIPSGDESELKFEKFFTFETFRNITDWTILRSVLLPDAAILDGWNSANNFDPFVPGRYKQWVDGLETKTGPVQEYMLDLMNVSRVERLEKNTDTGYAIIQREGGRYFHWFACAEGVEGTSQAWDSTVRLMESSAMHRNNTVIIEGIITSTDNDCENIASPEFTIIKHRANRLQFTIDNDSDGWLVISQTNYPGWRLKIDGINEKIYTGNTVFISFPVRAGLHNIELTYKPFTFYIGCCLSLVGLFVLCSLRKLLGYNS